MVVGMLSLMSLGETMMKMVTAGRATRIEEVELIDWILIFRVCVRVRDKVTKQPMFLCVLVWGYGSVCSLIVLDRGCGGPNPSSAIALARYH